MVKISMRLPPHTKVEVPCVSSRLSDICGTFIITDSKIILRKYEGGSVDITVKNIGNNNILTIGVDELKKILEFLT